MPVYRIVIYNLISILFLRIVQSRDVTLRISYIGYQTQEVSLNLSGRTEIVQNFEMAVDVLKKDTTPVVLVSNVNANVL